MVDELPLGLPFAGAEIVGDLYGEDDEITTVILSFNGDAFLGEAFESALAQETTRKHRIWIYDDASMDASQQLIRKLVQVSDGRAAGILGEANLVSRGVRIRNALYKHVRTRFIASLDGDDVWTDEKKLEKQCHAMDAAPLAAFSAHSCRTVDGAGKVLDTLVLPGPRRRRVSHASFAVASPVFSSSIVLRSSHFRRLSPVKGPAPRLQDWELWASLSLLGEVVVLDEIMADYRSHNSATGKWPIRDCLASDRAVRTSVYEQARGMQKVTWGIARGAGALIRATYGVSPRLAHQVELASKGALELPHGNLRPPSRAGSRRT